MEVQTLANMKLLEIINKVNEAQSELEFFEHGNDIEAMKRDRNLYNRLQQARNLNTIVPRKLARLKKACGVSRSHE